MGGSNSSPTSRTAGFRIVHIWKGSPAHLAGLELFFDCILEIDGLSFAAPAKTHPMEFTKQLAAAENRTVKLVVFNSRTRAFRDVWVTPRHWAPEQSLGLLGASVNFVENVFDDEPSGLRVLTVFPDSPASRVGLMPLDDFLMGAPDMEFKSLDDLLDLLSFARSENLTAIHLHVYNAKQEKVRTVTVELTEEWDGDGSLGCDVGQGLIHRLPRPRTIHPNSYTGYVYSDRKLSYDEQSNDDDNNPEQGRIEQPRNGLTSDRTPFLISQESDNGNQLIEARNNTTDSSGAAKNYGTEENQQYKIRQNAPSNDSFKHPPNSPPSHIHGSKASDNVFPGQLSTPTSPKANSPPRPGILYQTRS